MAYIMAYRYYHYHFIQSDTNGVKPDQPFYELLFEAPTSVLIRYPPFYTEAILGIHHSNTGR